jgi:hypothetical protein
MSYYCHFNKKLNAHKTLIKRKAWVFIQCFNNEYHCYPNFIRIGRDIVFSYSGEKFHNGVKAVEVVLYEKKKKNIIYGYDDGCDDSVIIFYDDEIADEFYYNEIDITFDRIRAFLSPIPNVHKNIPTKCRDITYKHLRMRHAKRDHHKDLW